MDSSRIPRSLAGTQTTRSRKPFPVLGASSCCWMVNGTAIWTAFQPKCDLVHIHVEFSFYCIKLPEVEVSKHIHGLAHHNPAKWFHWVRSLEFARKERMSCESGESVRSTDIYMRSNCRKLNIPQHVVTFHKLLATKNFGYI